LRCCRAYVYFFRAANTPPIPPPLRSADVGLRWVQIKLGLSLSAFVAHVPLPLASAIKAILRREMYKKVQATFVRPNHQSVPRALPTMVQAFRTDVLKQAKEAKAVAEKQELEKAKRRAAQQAKEREREARAKAAARAKATAQAKRSTPKKV